MLQQSKRKKFVVIAAIAGIIAASVIGAYFVLVQSTVDVEPVAQEDKERSDALGVAQSFILSSPTFAFDGDIDTLRIQYIGSTKSIPPEYNFRATFDSAHGGYGNREGQMLTQVITSHSEDIIVSTGIVTSAVIDETWDELHQQFGQYLSKLPSSDNPIISFEGMATDYSSLVDAIQSRGVLVDYIEEIPAENSSFSVPIKVISVGGVNIQVFEFQSDSDAQTASLTVSKDGTEIGTSIIRWMDAPHFYTNGKLLVLYVGQNSEIISLLESFLGKQFAGT
jgi:hypothetical protein